MSEPARQMTEPSRRLAEINRAITNSLSSERVLDLIVENARQLVDARVCVLLMIDGAGALRLQAARGLESGSLADFSGHMDEDVIKDLHGLLGVADDETLVSVPVMAQHSLNGMLAIVRQLPLDDEEQWQLSALADQAAIALRNARLYEIEHVEAKRLRDASEIARRRLAAIVESSDDAIVSKDLNGIIVSWNNGARRIFGFTAEEAIGRPVTILIPHDRLNEETLILERIRRGERFEHYETERQRKDGSLLSVSLTVSPIKNEQGEVIGASKIARDITDRKLAEAEREYLLKREHEARESAEEANRLKDEFLATLSHELRNPLNVILGYAEVLLRTKEPADPQLVKRVAQIVRRNALAQTQLISDLLDLSRLHTGKLSITREVCALGAVINNAVETVRADADAKNITLELNLPEEMLFVDADSLRLEQVAWNLLNNAIKFTPDGGAVTVSMERRQSDVKLVIADTGQGIDPAFLPHVFEMFRQADASTSRRHGGMGIGLALVRQLVELHGGSVAVHSAGRDQGAQFTVVLPLSYGVRDQLFRQEQVERDALADMRIMVVDDSDDTIDMLRALLESGGAIVTVASGGAEGLRIAGQNDFDAIVTDISMPGMDGFEFLRRLRALPRNKDVAVVALSGFGSAEDISRARAEGFKYHVTKPVNVRELIGTLRKLSQKQPPRSVVPHP